MLYLWMPEGQGQWLWQLDDGAWQLADSLDQLIQTIKPIYKGNEAVVFFPSQNAQFYTQSLTRAQYKQLGYTGTQYLIEDYTIEPIDHLAIFQHFQQDHIHFMAMPQQVRETFQQSLALLPWHISALLPDFLIAPEPVADGSSVLEVFNRHIVRWSNFRGWSFDDVSMLEHIPAKIEKIHFYAVSEPVIDAITEIMVARSEQDIVVERLTTQNLQLTRFKQHPFNALLKVKRKKSTGISYWKASAALLCVALIFQVSYDALRWWKYKQVSNQTAQLAVNQYQQWFPNESGITEDNLKRRFKAKIASNAAADRQALQLISRVGPVLQQANIAAQQVSYQDNALSMNLIARNSDALTQLTEQFKQQGFSAELGAIRSQNSQVVGLIKVQ